jgi:hypothetical protein
VVLGEPVAPKAPPFRMVREIERVAQRLARVAALRMGERSRTEKGIMARNLGSVPGM